MQAIEMEEKERKCGRRKAGGLYAVNSSASSGGGLLTKCIAVVIDPPVPLPEDFGSRRGYVYVDGSRLLDRKNPSNWRIEPRRAKANRWWWMAWGMPLSERAENGVGARAAGQDDLFGVLEECLTSLTFISEDLHLKAADNVMREVRKLRRKLPPCTVLPARWAAKGLHNLLNQPDDPHPALVLASGWQIADAVRWAIDVPVDLSKALQGLFVACGAVKDAAYLRDGWSPERQSFRLVPDLLDWVGQCYYETDEVFIQEADEQGISRRLPTLPHGAQPGLSRIFLAHPNCVAAGGRPAVFGWYYMAELQYIVGDTDEPMPDELFKAGAVPIKPVPSD